MQHTFCMLLYHGFHSGQFLYSIRQKARTICLVVMANQLGFYFLSLQLPFCFIDATGPYKVNGVPLRRVNQAYVIGTSTKVDISGVNAEKYDDKYFVRQVEKKQKKGESEFFEAEKKVISILAILDCSSGSFLNPNGAMKYVGEKCSPYREERGSEGC